MNSILQYHPKNIYEITSEPEKILYTGMFSSEFQIGQNSMVRVSSLCGLRLSTYLYAPSGQLLISYKFKCFAYEIWRHTLSSKSFEIVAIVGYIFQSPKFYSFSSIGFTAKEFTELSCVGKANSYHVFFLTSKMQTVPSLPAEYSFIPYAAGAHYTWFTDPSWCSCLAI